MVTGDAAEVHFGLRLLDRPQTTLSTIVTLVLSRPGNCGTCSVSQVIRATLSKTRP